MDAERSQRDEEGAHAPSASQKRPAEAPAEFADSENRNRLGLLSDEGGARAPPVSSGLTLNLFYREDGLYYDEEDLGAVLNALRRFGDLPSVLKVY